MFARYLPVWVFMLTAFVLSMVQLMVKNPMLIAERFLTGAGWVEILVISGYAAFVASKMRDPMKVPRWRKITWTLFTFVFFSQLILGLAGAEKFLMTGKLHLPVPAMIIAGPLYRLETSFMTILFISTVLISGPAWCSQLCYFGALDNLASTRKRRPRPLKRLWAYKHTFLLLTIAVALLLRLAGANALTATLTGAAAGLAGLAIVVLLSPGQGSMVHCIAWCPIGTLVSYVKKISPFRMRIRKSCTLCMACNLTCRYQALEKNHIMSGKPGDTCTLCGDCLASCKHDSIEYTFPGLKAGNARLLWVFLTISLHAVFLALGRI